MKKETKKTLLLALCALAVGASMLLAASGGRAVKTDYYDTQVKAAQQLQRCMERVKLYKQELSIPLSPDEYFDTGMLGEQYNFITTSIGELGAKRTSANPDMAALAVKMFYEAGLKKGDRIGAGFSGSFPCLNLAVICAAQVMEIEIVPITSVGASTYGANNPQLSFP
ncbi:MAG: poly-gamma-glutamate system protein, partial [Oscillospiraceae bacterium]